MFPLLTVRYSSLMSPKLLLFRSFLLFLTTGPLGLAFLAAVRPRMPFPAKSDLLLQNRRPYDRACALVYPFPPNVTIYCEHSAKFKLEEVANVREDAKKIAAENVADNEQRIVKTTQEASSGEMTQEPSSREATQEASSGEAIQETVAVEERRNEQIGDDFIYLQLVTSVRKTHVNIVISA